VRFNVRATFVKRKGSTTHRELEVGDRYRGKEEIDFQYPLASRREKRGDFDGRCSQAECEGQSITSKEEGKNIERTKTRRGGKKGEFFPL